MFHIGQLVVCVSGATETDYCGVSPQVRDAMERTPPAEVGRIYTIRDFDTRGCEFGSGNRPTVRVEEITGAIVQSHFGPWEIGFDADSFRPVRKTDISIFTESLKGISQKV